MPKRPLHPDLQRAPREIARFMDQCKLWDGTVDASGYPRTSCGRRSYYAHRVAFEQFWRLLKPGERVYRTCGERLCTNVFHLTTDAPQKRRKRRPGTSKLTARRVRAIREVWAGPDRPSQSALAQRYGVSRSTISLVVRGVTWIDVSDTIVYSDCIPRTEQMAADVGRPNPLSVLRSKMILSRPT